MKTTSMKGIPLILHKSEVWRLRENKMAILRTERSVVRVICEAQLKNRKRVKDFKLIGLNPAID